MSDFTDGLARNDLGWIPREHNNQPEDRAGRHGEIDAVVRLYQNKAPNINYYEPTQRDQTDLYMDSRIFGTVTTSVDLQENSTLKFPYQIGLRFFPTVRPIEEVMYGDGKQ